MKDSPSIPAISTPFLCSRGFIKSACSHCDTMHHLYSYYLSHSCSYIVTVMHRWWSLWHQSAVKNRHRRLSCKSSWCSTDHRCLSFCLNSSSATWDWLSVSCFDFSLPLPLGCALLMEANDAQKTDISYTRTVYSTHKLSTFKWQS